VDAWKKSLVRDLKDLNRQVYAMEHLSEDGFNGFQWEAAAESNAL
jgi:hypothetical protein